MNDHTLKPTLTSAPTEPQASALQFDIDDFLDVEQGELAIKHPLTGRPTGAVIILAGPEHPLRKKFVFQRQREMRAQYQESGKLHLDEPEQGEREATERMAEWTLGWNLRAGGQEQPFSKAAALQLYSDPKRQWLRSQVKEALDKRELFIAASARS